MMKDSKKVPQSKWIETLFFIVEVAYLRGWIPSA
jgi:hypothetical protein